MKATLIYSLARLGVFAAAFGLLLLTPMPIYFTAVLAALIALLISYIFFGSLRNQVALAVVRRREAPERDEDADLEDAVLDARKPAVRPARRQAPPSEDD